MTKNETYEEFIEKFKPKKTTDDCYTPPNVYNAIADWAAEEYGISRDEFVRPFYPGGDYEKYEYNNRIVVDNPPFSMLSKILDFYIMNNIRFFLFAPTLTIFSTLQNRACTALPIGVEITYHNGAKINTSFITNLEPQNIRIRTVPKLYQVAKNANQNNIKTKQLPKYTYPNSVVQAARICPYSRLGIEIIIPKEESVFIRRLDSQTKSKKTIFGGGFLVSKRCCQLLEKAEQKEIEQRKVNFWKLSERELGIINSLSQH